jgi:hypothetical protein
MRRKYEVLRYYSNGYNLLMPVPRWLAEFLQKEAEHLKLAANFIEEQPVPPAWRGSRSARG